MRRIATVAALAAVLACGCNASKSRGDEPSKEGKDGGESSGSGGLGMMSALLSAQSGQPGPYEAPAQSKNFVESEDHFEVLELGGKIVELQSLSLFGGFAGTEQRAVLEALREMSEDASVRGLLLRVGDLKLDVSQAEGLRAALLAFKSGGDKGRKLVCYAEQAGNSVYYLLSACDRIGLAPSGGLAITGPAAVPIHLKGLLDKIGVSADFIHIGAYKGAAEPLTREKPSPEMIETLQAILDSRYDTLVGGIAEGRKVAPEQAKSLIDTALFPDKQAVKAKLADEVATFTRFRREELGDTPWRVKKLAGEGVPKDMSKLLELLGLTPKKRPTEPHIALVYAVGNVVDGKGKGPIGARSEIASRTLSEALRALSRDDSVKGVVLRIDSGGGSALASEIIWQAMRELKKQKPVVVSMGSVAASGGYYIACAGTKIFAARNTLTGSIGVVGGKLVFGKGLEKLGVRAYPMGKGKRALIWSSLDPWSDEERAAIRADMEAVYQRFVGRVAESRGMSRDQVQAIAQGRVWTGKAALENGLIDAIGGLEDALGEARRLVKVPEEAPLEVYPPQPTLLDILEGFSVGGVTASGALGRAAAEIERTLGPEAGAAARSMLGELLRFRDQPVRTVTFLPAALQ